MTLKNLIKAGDDFQNGKIDHDEFVTELNNFYDEVLNSSDEEKIAFFNKMLETVRNNLSLDEDGYDDENQVHRIDGDIPHYIYEDLLTNLFGDKFFQFYNSHFEL